MYNQDEENSLPAAWTEFREQVRTANAVLFVTPEYNRSGAGCAQECLIRRTAALWEERLEGQAGAILSASPGALEGIRRESSFASILGSPRHPGDGAAGGLHRRRRHALGINGAPKVGDHAAWGPRIVQGKDAFYAHAIAGQGNMPARGGTTWPDATIRMAVDYMLSLNK